ncbi:MAG: hypothetical protein IIB77_04525 [Proteobacteria bacterium]|nr:hypothetical protein [Pseudomonadota bacterium]
MSKLKKPILLIYGSTDIQVRPGDGELLRSSSKSAELVVIDVSWYLRNAAGTPTTKGQSILTVFGFANIACQFLAAAGFLAPLPLVFVAGLILLLYVSIHNFVLLLVIGLADEASS